MYWITLPEHRADNANPPAPCPQPSALCSQPSARCPLGFLLNFGSLSGGWRLGDGDALRAGITIKTKAKEDRRHDESGREEVWRTHAQIIERPTKEKWRHRASHAAVCLLHTHVKAALSRRNHSGQQCGHAGKGERCPERNQCDSKSEDAEVLR